LGSVVEAAIAAANQAAAQLAAANLAEMIVVVLVINPLAIASANMFAISQATTQRLIATKKQSLAQKHAAKWFLSTMKYNVADMFHNTTQ